MCGGHLGIKNTKTICIHSLKPHCTFLSIFLCTMQWKILCSGWVLRLGFVPSLWDTRGNHSNNPILDKSYPYSQKQRPQMHQVHISAQEGENQRKITILAPIYTKPAFFSLLGRHFFPSLAALSYYPEETTKRGPPIMREESFLENLLLAVSRWHHLWQVFIH